MIFPDHSDQVRRRRQVGAGTMTAALLAIVITGIALVTLTSPDPEALEATTSTSTSTTSTTLAEIEPPIDLENFSVDQISRGEPFRWEPTLSVIDGFPMALVSHEDSLYLFATEALNSGRFGSFAVSGLRAWRSNDGVTWRPLGQVIDASHLIVSVWSTGQGLVALGYEPGSPGFTVWRSQDGGMWKQDEVVVAEANELTTVYPYAIGGSDHVLVVAGRIQMDVYALLEERLGGIAGYGWGTEVSGDNVTFSLYGPMGYPLAVFPAEDLGVTAEEQQMIIGANAPRTEINSDVWVKRGDDNWRRVVIRGAQWIEKITTTPDGGIIAHGWGPTGATSWTTSHGFAWDEVRPPTYQYLDERWRGRLVAQSWTGGTSVLISPDGKNWENIGPTEHFPGPIQWWTGALAAGPGGIAVTVHGWEERPEVEGPAVVAESPSITGEDGTLTIDFESSEYRLETEHRVHTWSSTPPATEGIEVDLDARTIRFSDPESDDLLATFPLEDFLAAQDEYFYTEEADTPGYDAFAFTSDGKEWTIQSIEDLSSRYARQFLAVTDTHVVATSLGAEGFYDPAAPPGFKVWTAAIP